MRRLIPDCAETSLEDELERLDLVSLAHEDRPYVVTNFVLTLDGHATLEGRSGPIGSEVDTALLVGLRKKVDALMIGAGTMRAERYGPVEPLMVLVSGRLDLPWDAPLFTAGRGRVVIATASNDEPPATETPVEVRRYEDGVDMPDLLAHLRAEMGIRALLSEGGPRLHAQMLEDGIVDELFVTHAPVVGGGVGPGLFAGLEEAERRIELAALMVEQETGEMFARYRVPAAKAG